MTNQINMKYQNNQAYCAGRILLNRLRMMRMGPNGLCDPLLRNTLRAESYLTTSFSINVCQSNKPASFSIRSSQESPAPPKDQWTANDSYILLAFVRWPVSLVNLLRPIASASTIEVGRIGEMLNMASRFACMFVHVCVCACSIYVKHNKCLRPHVFTHTHGQRQALLRVAVVVPLRR